MEFVAIARSVRISPRKVRLVADVVRNKEVRIALRTLAVVSKIASSPLEKTIKSALANAAYYSKEKPDAEKIDLEKLTIKSIEIFEGKSLKRFHPSTRGRVHPYKKRSSHIKIVLTDDKSQISNLKSQSKKGQNGTKS